MKKTDRYAQSMCSETFLKLLEERRMPLSEMRQDTVLKEISRLLPSQEFLLFCRVRSENQNDSEVPSESITQAPFLMADDSRYLPLFTDGTRMTDAGMDQISGFSFYHADLLDIISFLSANPSVSAAVLNPGSDDLVLEQDLLIRILHAWGHLHTDDSFRS